MTETEMSPRERRGRKAEKILLIIACCAAALFFVSSWLETVETGFFDYFYVAFRIIDYIAICLFVPCTLGGVGIFFVRYYRERKYGRRN